MEDYLLWRKYLKYALKSLHEISQKKKNIKLLERKINTQCVPFIRFYNLTSKEFMDRVLPYKAVIPKELYKDL